MKNKRFLALLITAVMILTMVPIFANATFSYAEGKIFYRSDFGDINDFRIAINDASYGDTFIYNVSATMMIQSFSPLTIPTGVTLQIDSNAGLFAATGGIITNNGIITNYGNITIYGTINNSNAINNFNGSITNNGTWNGNPVNNYYKVTFDANGGVFADGSDTWVSDWILDGDIDLDTVPVPTRSGYTFTGWSNKAAQWEEVVVPPTKPTIGEILKDMADDILKNGLADYLELNGKALILNIAGETIILSENANNMNISGEIVLSDGYILTFDIKGNGKNVKVFTAQK